MTSATGAASVRLPGLGMNSMLPEIHHGGSGRSPRPPHSTLRNGSQRTVTVRKFLEDASKNDSTLFRSALATPPKTARDTAPSANKTQRASTDGSDYGDASTRQVMLLPPEARGALEPVTTPLEADRTAFLELVAQMNEDADSFRSASVFCAALLNAARQKRRGYVTDREDSNARDLHRNARGPTAQFDPVRAASACWALDQMARQGACREIMSDIRDHLFPCLFVDFASPPNPVLLSRGVTEETIRSNPFLGYDFYFQHFHSVRNALTSTTEQRNALAYKCNAGMHLTSRVVNRLSTEFLRPIFTVWRTWVKKNRIDRFSKDLLRRHGNRDSRRVTLDGAMARWRLAVSQGKVSNLKQRVYAVEYQLENTKNQFQLQCFRSDKYLRLVEELREELAQVREHRDDLTKQVRDLRAELQAYQDTSREQLNRYVTVGIEELNRWRRFVRRRVENDAARADALTFATSGEGNADAEGAGEDVDTGADNTTAEVEAQLLHWCSGVMRQSVVSTIKAVTNWTSDWHSGEVLLLLMHHVFPATVPLAPLQETSVAKRVEQIVEIGKKIGVAHLPKPSDIVDGAGDMMILVASELYNRFAAMTRVRDAAPPFEPVEHHLEAPLSSEHASAPAFDADMLPDVLADADRELRRLVDCDTTSMGKDQHVWRTQEILNTYTSYITRERMEGRTVVVVDKKDVARFCKFAKNRYGDVAVKFKMPPIDFTGMWQSFDQQLDALRNSLQRNYQDLRRIFNFYCRGKSLMSEADFWRFIADIRALDKVVTRAHVDKIFSIANDDTPPVPKVGRSMSVVGISEDDDDDGVDKGDEEVDDDEENSETELIPSEFVETLVRIAEKKFPGKMLHERFEMLMNIHVIPFACKSDTDKFKKEIHSAQTQTAVQKYQKDLIKVFNYYAKGATPATAGGKNAGKKTKTMVLHDFLHFMKESNIMSQALDETSVTSVFNTVSSSSEEANKEIDHREFLEAIVCMSVFKVPSPFIPLDKKVEVLSSALINNLKNKLKPTVTLSDMPVVTLKQS